MKFNQPVILSAFIFLCSDATSSTRTINAPLPQRSAVNTTNDSNNDAQLASQNLKRVLDKINDSWFGTAYTNINAVEIQGNLAITLKAADLNAKIRQQNYSDAEITPIVEDCKVDLKVKGTYFSNANFRMELSGGFGNLIYYRVGNKGFLYSREQNAWTSRVDLPPANAPSSFFVWFRQCIDEIQKTYLDRVNFQSSTKRETDSTRTIAFVSNTARYNPNKREQTIDESLDFWKNGKVEVTFNKTTYQPQQMHYSNEDQGIYTDTTFHYNAEGRPGNFSIDNKSKNMSGPMSLHVNYDSSGLIDHISGKTTFSKGSMRFNMKLAFVKDRNVSSIITVPPPTATKKSREELEMLLLINAGVKVHKLQQIGLGIRGPKVAGR